MNHHDKYNDVDSEDNREGSYDSVVGDVTIYPASMLYIMYSVYHMVI